MLGRALVGMAAAPLAAVLLAGAALSAGATGPGPGAGGGAAGAFAGRPGAYGAPGYGPGAPGGVGEWAAGLVAASAATVQPGGTADIPAGMLSLYRAAAATCPGLPWEVLAGIGRVETDHGRAVAVSSAGALGPMQFLPSTWAEYGVDVHGTGSPDVNDPADAVFGAARMLCADGAGTPGGVPGAVYAYNHSAAYVAAVLGWAATYARSAP